MGGIKLFTTFCKSRSAQCLISCVLMTCYSSCDKATRYVAQENILPITQGKGPSEGILRLAGRFFKRWDKENHIFVSNVKDEYPDD
jgi:hypothetical protein